MNGGRLHPGFIGHDQSSIHENDSRRLARHHRSPPTQPNPTLTRLLLGTHALILYSFLLARRFPLFSFGMTFCVGRWGDLFSTLELRRHDCDRGTTVRGPPLCPLPPTPSSRPSGTNEEGFRESLRAEVTCDQSRDIDVIPVAWF